MWLSIVSIIVAGLTVLIGLIYLWDYFVCENMKKSTIAILSVVSILAFAVLAAFGIFACNDFKLSKGYDTTINADGKTITVTEHYLLGLTRTVENVKAPIATSGKIMETDTTANYVVYKIQLTDGRMVSYNDSAKNMSSDSVIVHEEYYPKYRCRVTFSTH